MADYTVDLFRIQNPRALVHLIHNIAQTVAHQEDCAGILSEPRTCVYPLENPINSLISLGRQYHGFGGLGCRFIVQMFRVEA